MSHLITIDSLAAGGDGVGRDTTGRVTFVPFSAPGDQVEVTLTKVKTTVAWGEIENIVVASDRRTLPTCKLFTRCGGCTWQHVDYTAQAEAKRDIVAAALRSFASHGLVIEPIQTPVAPYQWRRRTRLHWQTKTSGAPTLLGFYGPKTTNLIDIPQCPQLDETLHAALETVRAQLVPRLRSRGELYLVVGDNNEVHVANPRPMHPRRY